MVVLRRVVEVVGIGTVFVTGVASAVVLHADSTTGRRTIAETTNRALAGVFTGTLRIEGLDRIELGRESRVRATRVTVLGPDGAKVLDARGLDVSVDLLRLLTGLRAADAVDLVLPRARIESVDVVVDRAPSGDIGLAQAFLPRSGKPRDPRAPASPSPRVRIPSIAIGHASVSGNVAPPRLDADADDTLASLRLEDESLTIDLERSRITLRSPTLPRPEGVATTTPILLHADAHGGLTVRDSKLSAHADARGDVDGVPFVAKASLADGTLDASIDVARVSVDRIARIVPVGPVRHDQEVELSAKATGPLGDLRFAARGSLGTSRFDATAALKTSGAMPFSADATLVDVDPAAFGGPAGTGAATVHAEGTLLGAGAPQGTFRVSTAHAKIGEATLPDLTASGTFDPRTLTVTARGTDRGVTAEASAAMDLATQRVTFRARADAARLDRMLPRTSGRASITTIGSVDVRSRTIAGSFAGTVDGFGRDGIAVAHANVSGRFQGPAAAPVVDVDVRGQDVSMTAPGKAPLAWRKVDAAARVTLASGAPVIVDPRVVVEDELGSRATVTASRVSTEAGRVVVDGARAEGFGGPIVMDVRLGPAWHIRAHADDVLVAKVAALGKIPELTKLPEGARASFDVDLAGDARGVEGHADVALVTIENVGGKLHAEAHGRRVTLSGDAAWHGLARVSIPRAELELPYPLSLATLPRTTGAADVTGEVDLSQAATLFADAGLANVAGWASVEAHVERARPDAMPTVSVTARTAGLTASLEQDGETKAVRGVDGSVHLSWDGVTDAVDVATLVWDDAGLLASANAKANVPLASVLAGAVRIDRQAIEALHVAARADVPARDLGHLPAVFAPTSVRGSVGGSVTLSGPLSRPDVRATLVASALESVGSDATGQARKKATFEPIDATMDLRWDGERVVSVLRADERVSGQPRDRVAHVRGLVIGRLLATDVLRGDARERWTASVELDAKELELTPLPLPNRITGVLNGRVKVRGLNESPSLEAGIDVRELTVAGGTPMTARIDLGARDHSLFGSLHLTQPDGGHADVRIASAALAWERLSPTWEPTTTTRIDYDVSNVRLALAQPFIRRATRDLDGRVDGRGMAQIDAKSQVFEGGLTVTGGRAYVNALGEEVTDATLQARFDRSGVFYVENANAKVGSGIVRLAAAGRFEGTRFAGAKANLVIPEGEGVPLSSEGATFANASGLVDVEVTVSADASKITAVTGVPRAAVVLPERKTQSLQSLDPDASIAIGVRGKDGKLLVPVVRRRGAPVATPGTPAATTRIEVTLGDEVYVEDRGMRIQLGGKTVVELGNELKVSGRIDLRGGTISKEGRRFVVDHGSISFSEDGDPANPTVIAAAYWDAPGDKAPIRVWVEFIGPLKTGKLTLRSEPAYSQSEIGALLVFGRPDPNVSAGSQGSSDATRAAQIGAGAVSSGLNQALGDLSDTLEFGSDTTRANRQVQTFGWKARRNLKVSIGYSPSAGTYRDRDSTFLFIDWNFIPQWKLAGTGGDAGTSIVDVLYQLRY